MTIKKKRIPLRTKIKAELDKAHQLLTLLKVPDDIGDLSDRIVWLIYEGTQGHALEVAQEKAGLGAQVTDKLKKMAELYEQEHGPDQGGSTNPWLTVRWVKRNLGK